MAGAWHALLFQAYMDTLQTQWSWILQITKCIDVHLKENAAYFQVPDASWVQGREVEQCKGGGRGACPRAMLSMTSEQPKHLEATHCRLSATFRARSFEGLSLCHRLYDL